MIAKFANTARCLAVDMVNAANSGHQGSPLGLADVMSVLFNASMNFLPACETRDRLVLSAGHASALLYASIYLTQKTSLTIDDLKKFRKFGGICQGHPEINKLMGIEMTTGALGQGIATSVGIAIALKKKGLNSKVFTVVGDGDLMEGVSHEAMTMAASLGLNNLIILFDDNDVCIDGHASSFTTNNMDRFAAYGFDVYSANGHDYEDIYGVIESAKNSNRPAFISFKTIIGKFTEKEGTSACHGKFVSNEEARLIRKRFGFPDGAFEIPDGVLQQVQDIPQPCVTEEKEDAIRLHEAIGDIKADFVNNPVTKSTRYFGGVVFGKLLENFGKLIGGSADLSESNCTISKNSVTIDKGNFSGNYVHYGIREHAMGCVMNGLAIEGFIPYGGTFLVFSDYMRPALRNAALMHVAPIFVLTHDSVAVGEDGATHQPIEHLSSLRLIPNLNVFRPCCDAEVAECVELAMLNRNSPTALILSRQNVMNLRNTFNKNNLCAKGMYEISPFAQDGTEKLSIIATGSEVSLAFKAKEVMNFDVRIISAPSLELFDSQPEEYKSEILSGRKLFIEAGTTAIWHKYKTTSEDMILGIDDFGESGTAEDLFGKFNFTSDWIKSYYTK